VLHRVSLACLLSHQIHGIDGLGGVEGLPSITDAALVERAFAGRRTRALDAMASAIRKVQAEESRVTIATCGPLTNLALFISVYPELLASVEQIVFMGGGVGIGNRSSTSGTSYLYDEFPLPSDPVDKNSISFAIVGSTFQRWVSFDSLFS
jgi:inosine-uridine nucleoside N-ribohydrolase